MLILSNRSKPYSNTIQSYSSAKIEKKNMLLIFFCCRYINIRHLTNFVIIESSIFEVFNTI